MVYNIFLASNDELTHEEQQRLKARHGQTKDKRQAERLKAVYLLSSGWSATDVAQALLLDPDTVRSYFRQYQTGGIEQLLRFQAGGSQARLSAGEQQQLKAHLDDNLCLSTHIVIAYVKEQWNIHYSERGMNHLLHRLDYVYKKPQLVPGKANIQAQKEFLVEYEALRKQQPAEAPCYFMDATHPLHNPIANYGWIKRGQDYAVKTNTGRRRLNINGAMNISTLEPVIRYDDTINADSTIALFKQIEAKHLNVQNIPVIADNARYYHAKIVSEYLQTSRIQLIFLPPYAPNLNLIERYWKFFKKNVLYGTYYETFDRFKLACDEFFNQACEHVVLLRSLLAENFQLIAAP